MPAARILSLCCAEEGREVRQPLLAAGHQISRSERIGEFLQAIRRCAFQEGIGELLESDAVLAHAVGQPMVLIEADAGGERKIGADAHEHPSPVPVIDVKVVLNDPAIRDLKMPPVRDLVADSNHDAGGLARFEDDHHGVRLGSFEIRIDEVVTTALRRLHDRDVALRGPLLHPALKLVGDVAQGVPRHRVKLPIRIEEADDPLWLLERLNQPVQQNAVETTIMPMDAVFVVLVEGVHDRLPAAGQQRDRSGYSRSSTMAPP